MSVLTIHPLGVLIVGSEFVFFLACCASKVPGQTGILTGISQYLLLRVTTIIIIVIVITNTTALRYHHDPHNYPHINRPPCHHYHQIISGMGAFTA